jgi:hypothetical protein
MSGYCEQELQKARRKLSQVTDNQLFKMTSVVDRAEEVEESAGWLSDGRRLQKLRIALWALVMCFIYGFARVGQTGIAPLLVLPAFTIYIYEYWVIRKRGHLRAAFLWCAWREKKERLHGLILAIKRG